MTGYPETVIEKSNIKGVPATPPKVSIIIPAYNASEFIVETLESVFAQTFTDYEIILVNDGSTDTEKLEAVLTPYFDKLTYIKQENKGIALSRNAAIQKATGEFLAFIDSDDIWFPNYLEKQLKAIDERQCDLIYADAYLFGEGIKEGKRFSDKAPSIGKITTENMIRGKSCVILSGTVVSRQKVIDNRMFDDKVPWMGMEDFDLWFRLAKNNAKLDYQKEVLLKYRVHSKSISGNRLNIMQRGVAASEHIERTYDLTDSEKEAIRTSRINADAQMNVERAKLSMIQGNYPDAIDYFQKANESLKQTKLSIVITSLKISPKVFLFLLKKIQPNEYKTISANRK